MSWLVWQYLLKAIPSFSSCLDVILKTQITSYGLGFFLVEYLVRKVSSQCSNLHSPTLLVQLVVTSFKARIALPVALLVTGGNRFANGCCYNVQKGFEALHWKTFRVILAEVVPIMLFHISRFLFVFIIQRIAVCRQFIFTIQQGCTHGDGNLGDEPFMQSGGSIAKARALIFFAIQADLSIH